MSSLPQMSRPPVYEVVCGVAFQRLAALNPQLVGAYWYGRRNDFPRTETKTAVGAIFTLGSDATAPPLRTWLVSEAGDFVLQIQDDRFFLNWRSRGRDLAYPRFDPAICARAVDEFASLKSFCAREIGEELKPSTIEMAKINLLYHGRHWRDWNDLADVVPMLKPLLRLSTPSADPSIVIRLTDKPSISSIAVSVEIGTDNTTQIRVAKLENKVVRNFSGDLRADFLSANDELNRLFAQQVPEHLMHERFNGGLNRGDI